MDHLRRRRRRGTMLERRFYGPHFVTPSLAVVGALCAPSMRILELVGDITDGRGLKASCPMRAAARAEAARGCRSAGTRGAARPCATWAKR